MGVDVKIEGGILLSNWHGMRLDGGTDMANMANDDATSLKLSLKSKILLRRRKEGLNDIKVDFTPRPSYPVRIIPFCDKKVTFQPVNPNMYVSLFLLVLAHDTFRLFYPHNAYFEFMLVRPSVRMKV